MGRAPSLVLLVALTGASTAVAGPIFVDVQAVAPALRTPAGPVSVIDTRGPVDFAVGHIPGAVRMAWTDTARSGLREGRLRDTKALAARFRAAGVDNARPVLVCGDAAAGWGEEGRVAWALIVLGHPQVQVLDGGCAVWGEAGRRVERGLGHDPAPGKFVARPTTGPLSTKADLAKALEEVTVLDVRTAAEYAGATPYFAARGGHVPGARHLHFKDLLDARGRVKKGKALDKVLQQHGVARDRPVISYCTGGVRSAFVTLVLRDAGIEAANYAGSWWEWAADERLPITVPVP